MTSISPVSLQRRFQFMLVAVLAVFLTACGGDPEESESYINYMGQDTSIEGKAGVLLTSMGLPETYEFGFFDRYLHHIFDVAFPWYAKWIIMRDSGIVLRDPQSLFASEEFKPTTLVDCYGKSSNAQGTPYTELAVEWKPPRQEGGAGHFLLPQKNGHVDIIEKVAVKMVALDYAKMPGKVMPTRKQQLAIDKEVARLLAQEFPGIPFETAFSFYPNSIEAAVSKLLAAGVETIVVTDVFPAYSSLEQLDSLFVLIAETVNDRAKLVFTPNIGAFPSFRKAYTQLARDEVAALPESSRNLIILTRHGMPEMKGEAYPLFAPVHAQGMTRDMTEALKGTDSKIVVADTDFAEDDDDPDNLRLAATEAIAMGISEGYDHIIMVLVDFLTENTDSIFASRYESLGEYGFAYEGEVPYTEQDRPYRTTMTQGKTTIIVAGTPVGEPYRNHLAQGIFDAMATVLREQEWPQVTNSLTSQ